MMQGSPNVHNFSIHPHPSRKMDDRGKILNLPGVTLFVTRNATLEYQKLTRAQFETARRSLTLRILHAQPDPEHRECYLFRVEGPAYTGSVRVYTERDGELLVVTKIAAVE